MKGVQKKDTTKTSCVSFILRLGFGVGATVGERCTKKKDTMKTSCVSFVLRLGFGAGATVGERCTKE